MRDLYDQLIADGERAVEQLVTERRQENVGLEFKTKASPATGEPNRDDRRNLGIVLSALSNSMGGLIVWGVRAEKNSDNVDCATELQPISEIERFKADVARLLSQALMPRHEGIFVEAIPARNPKGAGYLAVYVERSERRPHRCELVEKQYFKRIGDSSIAMEHYDIEDSFKRLVVPWLELGWRISPFTGPFIPDDLRLVSIDLDLHNPSQVTARFPYLTLLRVVGASVQKEGANAHQSGLPLHEYHGEFHFAGGAHDVVHPGLTLPAGQLVTGPIAVEPREAGRCRVRRGSFQPVTVAYQCGCYNSRPTVGKFTISDNDLVEHGIDGGFIY
jgi:hypothetical protein